MNHQIELRLPEGIQWTARSLTLPPETTYEQKLEVGRYLAKAEGALLFWKADWLKAVRRDHGDEQAGAALKQLAFEFADIKAMESLSKLEVRALELTPEHHFVLAKAALPPQDQQSWVETAQREKLSAAELQLSIRKKVVTRIEQSNGSSAGGVPTLQGLRGQWDILKRSIDKTLADYTLDDARQARELIAPIVAFDAELVRRFPQLISESGKQESRNGGAA